MSTKMELLSWYRAVSESQEVIMGRCWGGRVLHVWLGRSDLPAICGSHVERHPWSTEWSYGTPLCPKCVRRIQRTIAPE